MDGMEKLRERLVRIPGVVESPSMFKDDVAFWVNGREIAHFENSSGIDIRLTRREISAAGQRLRDDPLVRRRSAKSDWVVVDFATADGAARAVELAQVAARAHEAPEGAAAKPPPDGARLRSLRRFHVRKEPS